MSSADLVAPASDRGSVATGSAASPSGIATAEAPVEPRPREVAASLDEGESFYAKLGDILEFRELTEPGRYATAPPSSLLVLTRVHGVARAIAAGRYQHVNALSVASIVAVQNAMADLEIPYVFAGDAATLLIPASRRWAAERALRAVRSLAEASFGLDLRASVVPASELAAAGQPAKVGRFRLSEHARLAMFSGGACATARRWCDDPERSQLYTVSVEGERQASYAGFECRWQPVTSQRGHTVSLIVSALAPAEVDRKQTYEDLLRAFERIVDTEACHPIKVADLESTKFFGDHSIEARIRAQTSVASVPPGAAPGARKPSFIGRLLQGFGKGGAAFDSKKYKRELCGNCDYRKFDDSLRLLVDLNVAEVYRLESRLSAEHRAGRLAYGLHRSPSALITSAVRSHDGDHVHFVDGSDGGYALAAQQLEEQLRENLAGKLKLPVKTLRLDKAAREALGTSKAGQGKKAEK